MFFGLSGFLVAASGKRLDVVNFFINRASRILPALCVEVFLSALILGPILTDFTWKQYFSDPLFVDYFSNIVGAVHFSLPGVQFTPPYPSWVNAQLWTIPAEMLCYVIMGIIIVSRLTPNTIVITIFAIFLFKIQVIASTLGGHSATEFLQNSLHLSFLLNPRGVLVVPCFLFGVAAHNLKDKIPYDRRLFAITILALLILGLVGDFSLLSYEIIAILFCLLSLYIILFIGVSDIKQIAVRGDYSYGMYLYGFPLQQTISKCLPQLNGISPIFHFILSLTLATFFAALSWHLIEKPVLYFRKSFAILKQEQLNVEPGDMKSFPESVSVSPIANFRSANNGRELAVETKERARL